ncbi:MAG: hypothetical protein Q9159_001327 [Coniocarpon cinnabarinum]
MPSQSSQRRGPTYPFDVDFGFEEDNPIDYLILGCWASMIPNAAAIGTITHPITQQDHVVVIEEHRSESSAYGHCCYSQGPSRNYEIGDIERHRVHITDVNRTGQPVGQWAVSPSAAVVVRGIRDNSKIVASFSIKDKVTLFRSWYHFQPQGFNKSSNLRDAPFLFVTVSVSRFLRAEKEGNIPLGCIQHSEEGHLSVGNVARRLERWGMPDRALGVDFHVVEKWGTGTVNEIAGLN